LLKTVLLITSDETHRVLKEIGLKNHFAVEFIAKSRGGSGNVDAIVYDIPMRHSDIDIQWLKELDLPVVVLTPESEFPLPESSLRRILTYPVSAGEIVHALEDLGVQGSPAGEAGKEWKAVRNEEREGEKA
jgi:hypothetical protein